MRIRPRVRTKREVFINLFMRLCSVLSNIFEHGNIEEHCHIIYLYTNTQSIIYLQSIPFDGNERSILSLGRSARSTIVERVDSREAEKYCVVSIEGRLSLQFYTNRLF